MYVICMEKELESSKRNMCALSARSRPYLPHTSPDLPISPPHLPHISPIPPPRLRRYKLSKTFADTAGLGEIALQIKAEVEAGSP